MRGRIDELCLTRAGREEAAKMTFSCERAEVRERLEVVAEMITLETSDNRMPLGGLRDISAIIKRCQIQGMYITAEELPMVQRTLEAIGAVERYLRNSEQPLPRLRSVADTLIAFPQAIRAIEKVADPVGNILDHASPQLAQIRGDLRRISGAAAAIMRRVMAQAVAAGMLEADATPAMRDGRMVLPVMPMYKRKIQGIVHDESASGKTVFIEPAEVVEVNNRTRELEIEERREIVRILRELTDQLRPEFDAILQSYSVMAQLDFIRAKALYADETGGSLPTIEEGPAMEWRQATHPTLLATLKRQGKDVVPLDIKLTQDSRLLIISGPNAGGKSVCLKTVGVVQYMAQCGLLPSLKEDSRLGIFEDIFIDIGDDQSLENDLSTYSSHLRNMRLFLVNGRSTSLVLVDEMGSGTEPLIGGALAQAILKEMNQRKMWGVVTTHYQNLKQLAEHTAGMQNGSMLYDRQQMLPMFRLAQGVAGSSFAIEIAHRMGLPTAIIEDAKEIVGADYVNMDKYLLDIARDRRYWENKRQEIRQKEKRLEATLEKYQEDAQTLHLKRKEILEEARGEARQIVEGSNAAIERAIREIREAQAEKERTRVARERLNAQKAELAETAPADHPLLAKAQRSKRTAKDRDATKSTLRPTSRELEKGEALGVGSFVRLDGQGTPGQILELHDQEATVSFGMLKTTVKLSRLKPTQARPKSGVKDATYISKQTASASRERQLQFSREIDVRGFRADEALQAVTYFIDDAIEFAQGQVRILHGTGTGALRQAIRSYLASVHGVRGFRDEDVRFGGAGITVVDLD